MESKCELFKRTIFLKLNKTLLGEIIYDEILTFLTKLVLLVEDEKEVKEMLEFLENNKEKLDGSNTQYFKVYTTDETIEFFKGLSEFLTKFGKKIEERLSDEEKEFYEIIREYAFENRSQEWLRENWIKLKLQKIFSKYNTKKVEELIVKIVEHGNKKDYQLLLLAMKNL